MAASTLAAAAPAAASAVTVQAAHGVTAGRAFGAGVPATAPRLAPGLRDGSVEFTNWAGYAVTSGGNTSVSASWVAPAVTCSSSKSSSAFWVGLDGFESDSVEQTGTTANCSGGKAHYFAWYEFYPSPVTKFPNRVKPGDDISASITYVGSNMYDVAISDAQQGWNQAATVTISGDERASAEVITEAPCCTKNGNPEPLANFGTVNFSNATVNGAAIGTLNPTEIIMIGNKNKDKATPSALSGNTNFSVTFDRST